MITRGACAKRRHADGTDESTVSLALSLPDPAPRAVVHCSLHSTQVTQVSEVKRSDMCLLNRIYS